MNIRARQEIALPRGLVSSIIAIWNAISEDMDVDDAMTNEEAIEICLDADRLITIEDRKDLNEFVSQCGTDGLRQDLLMQLSETIDLV
jgi:hypothetical protein